MKYTNKYRISPLIAGMIQRSMERYDSGGSDYSCTTLIDAPKPQYLKKKHFDEVKTDVSTLMAAFFGNAMHDYLEGLAEPGDLTEYRLFQEISGRVISGCVDIMKHLGDAVYQIGDYKTSKVWAVVNGKEETFKKWEEQLNINAWLARKNDIKIDDTAFIECFFMDWQKGRASGDYPKIPQQRYEFKLWSIDEQEKFVRERIAIHEICKMSKGESTPCTDKDTWKVDTWKLLKKGRKTAVKNEKSEADIKEYAMKKKIMRLDGTLINGYSIECFPGEHKRCMEYCDASEFCEQWQGVKEDD